MKAVPYRWRCLACGSGNAASSQQCERCGCPARPRMVQIERCARLVALRSDKVFAPADADLAAAARAPSPQRTAWTVLAVLASWAVLAVVIRLSMAPVAGSRVGGWLLGAMMVAVAVLAPLSCVIVYRAARGAQAES
ncbi:hypothetical protein ACFPOE_08035 [Caenimonas terrae]|uniref:RanBP2-type domain-containing protein n=1 Tax=Caenimonas terrae TaxID=696074 RepID=A0ABW0NC47_9BURK